MKFHIYKPFILHFQYYIYIFKVLDESLFHFRSVFMLLGPSMQTNLLYFKITFANFNENTCKKFFIEHLHNLYFKYNMLKLIMFDEQN
jgi:hypothetical protein